MHLYRIEERQTVPADLPNAWDFFSSPANLAHITPPDMGFEVTVSPPERIYPGLIISYRVRPLHDHLIHPRLRTIFEYRRRALERIFGPPPPARTTNLEPPTNDAEE